MFWELSDGGRSILDDLDKRQKSLNLMLSAIQILADKAELLYHIKMCQVKFSKTQTISHNMLFSCLSRIANENSLGICLVRRMSWEK